MEIKAELKNMGFQHLSGLTERKSLGQHVFENIKQAIIKGDIPSGQRLVESRLAATLDISRTPVREAIHKLEREGYLTKRPRGGFVVLGLGSDDIEETFGIRGVLEGYAARLAAIKHDEKDLEPLEARIRTFQQHLNNGNLEVLPDINTEFHELLYALSRSPRLIKMINDLKDQIYRFRQMILKDAELAGMSNEDHRHMLEFIKRRDAKGVEKVVREHLMRGQTAVMKSIKGNSV
ncbi:MAG: GntR family transcriptional regulator [Deltaproteobacteria bacterium]|nr:GntR family transcriptional regulator [Deltaproteobacteria bacterium]